MLDPVTLAKKVGGKVLFVGIEAYGWGLNDYAQAAKTARALGFDALSPKIADGENRWYKNAENLVVIRDSVLSQGCNFVPFVYCYGPKFGNTQIATEAAIAKEIASVCNNIVCLDLETEWNGQSEAATYLASLFTGTNIDLIVTTWADPSKQDWMKVLSALDPVVAAWCPQEYSSWLSGQESDFAQAGIILNKLFPAIDISDLYSDNNPLAILQLGIARGHASFWVWEYGAAIAVSGIVKSLFALFPKNALPVIVAAPPLNAPAGNVTGHPIASNPNVTKTVPVPVPARVQFGKYKVSDGDSLATIAARLHIANWYQDLYMLNKQVLDTAAQAHGQPNCQNGNLIYADTVISYPLF